MKLFTIKILHIFFIIISLTYCSSGEKKSVQNKVSHKKIKKDIVQIIYPVRNSKFKINQNITFSLKTKNSVKLDSVICILNNQKTCFNNINTESFEGNLINNYKKTGEKNISFISYTGDSISEYDNIKITILSDLKPENYTYKILNTYKHQINAYTQGLTYENGYVYEGTGDWGLSRIMKYKVENGNPVNEIIIDQHLFGEGIEIVDDEIIQLTYKAQKGFIYNKNSFEKIREFNYPYIEGWGITYDGKNIIMSDGSNILYFLDKKYLTEIARLEVYDDFDAIDSINEMEYVNGQIYANVYLKDYIICIDPKTGRVTRKIDMSDMLLPSDHHDKINVLNGIAYNNDKNTFYVTGKNWPKLFEVEFIKK